MSNFNKQKKETEKFIKEFSAFFRKKDIKNLLKKIQNERELCKILENVKKNVWPFLRYLDSIEEQISLTESKKIELEDSIKEAVEKINELKNKCERKIKERKELATKREWAMKEGNFLEYRRNLYGLDYEIDELRHEIGVLENKIKGHQINMNFAENFLKNMEMVRKDASFVKENLNLMFYGLLQGLKFKASKKFGGLKQKSREEAVLEDMVSKWKEFYRICQTKRHKKEFEKAKTLYERVNKMVCCAIEVSKKSPFAYKPEDISNFTKKIGDEEIDKNLMGFFISGLILAAIRSSFEYLEKFDIHIDKKMKGTKFVGACLAGITLNIYGDVGDYLGYGAKYCNFIIHGRANKKTTGIDCEDCKFIFENEKC